MTLKFLPGPLHVFIIWVLHWEIQEKHTHTHIRQHTLPIKVTHTYYMRLPNISQLIKYNLHLPWSVIIHMTWNSAVPTQHLLQWSTCSSCVRLIMVMKKMLSCHRRQHLSDRWGLSLQLNNGHSCYPPFLKSHLINCSVTGFLPHLVLTTKEPPPQHIISCCLILQASVLTYCSPCLWAGPGCGRSGTGWCQCGAASPQCPRSASSCCGHWG